MDDGTIEEHLEELQRAFEFHLIEDLSDDESEGDEDSDNEDEDEDSEDGDAEADDLTQFKELSSRRRKRFKIDRRESNYSYYRETWSGASASQLLFSLAVLKSKSTNEVLWNGIVGVTSQYLANNIDLERYAIEASEFDAEWSRLNTRNSDEDDAAAASGLPEENPLLARDKLDKFADGRILKEKEYRFMLLKHWNIYESMLYSVYTATKLRIWSERGRQRLDTLLSKMG